MRVFIEANSPTSRCDPCRLHDAAVFYGRQLFSSRLFAQIKVRLVLVHNLTRMHEIEADTVWDDYHTRPREFTIRLDSSMGTRRQLVALAHEIVHVHQFATGRLKDRQHTRVALWNWAGKPFTKRDVDYWLLPWEIEAHGMQEGLYHKFRLEHRRQSNMTRRNLIAKALWTPAFRKRIVKNKRTYTRKNRKTQGDSE